METISDASVPSWTSAAHRGGSTSPVLQFTVLSERQANLTPMVTLIPSEVGRVFESTYGVVSWWRAPFPFVVDVTTLLLTVNHHGALQLDGLNDGVDPDLEPTATRERELAGSYRLALFQSIQTA